MSKSSLIASLNVQPEPEKNFGLSPDDFQQMLEDLKRNDTAFFERVFLKQFEETMRYLKRECGSAHDDAYDAVMDTMLELRYRFVEGKLKYGNLRFLFTQMVKQSYFRQQKQFSTVGEEAIPDLGITISKEERNEEIALLTKAWANLGENCKSLLTWHFYGNMKLKEIAEQEDKTPISIRKQKERCLNKLKDFFSNHLNLKN